MLSLVVSLLGVFPWLVLQLYRLLILVQAEMLVEIAPAQWVVGPIFGFGRAHTFLTVRLPRGPLPDEPSVQTVTRLLKGLDWSAASEAVAAAQHQLTGGMAVATGRKLKPTVAAQRRRRGERGAAWWQRGMGPVTGLRVTHAHVHRTDTGHERGVVKAWYLTPGVKWVDATELTLLPTLGRHLARGEVCREIA